MASEMNSSVQVILFTTEAYNALYTFTSAERRSDGLTFLCLSVRLISQL